MGNDAVVFVDNEYIPIAVDAFGSVVVANSGVASFAVIAFERLVDKDLSKRFGRGFGGLNGVVELGAGGVA